MIRDTLTVIARTRVSVRNMFMSIELVGPCRMLTSLVVAERRSAILQPLRGRSVFRFCEEVTSQSHINPLDDLLPSMIRSLLLFCIFGIKYD